MHVLHISTAKELCLFKDLPLNLSIFLRKYAFITLLLMNQTMLRLAI